MGDYTRKALRRQSRANGDLTLGCAPEDVTYSFILRTGFRLIVENANLRCHAERREPFNHFT